MQRGYGESVVHEAFLSWCDGRPAWLASRGDGGSFSADPDGGDSWSAAAAVASEYGDYGTTSEEPA